MTPTFLSIAFSLPRFLSSRLTPETTTAAPTPRNVDLDREGRAFAMEMMDHCPDALAHESDVCAMMYIYSGRY